MAFVPPDITQRHILITGCSSGIGYCVARGLAERGYPVVASARKAEDVTRLQQDGLFCVQLDLDDSASIEQALQQTLRHTGGKLYALFNNGAYGQPGALEDLSRDTVRQLFESNFFGWHELTVKVLPVMRQQGYGRIIQNSSVLGFISLPFRGPYNASKYAIEGWSDTLRLELTDSDIEISLIEPGPITSRFRANAMQAFERHVAIEQSRFNKQYNHLISKLTREGAVAPGTLGPEAVLKKVIHALESKRPRPRYYVTWPTYLFGTLKRLLSTRALDRILGKIG